MATPHKIKVCDGDAIFGLSQLLCAPTLRLSYVRNAYSSRKRSSHPDASPK